MKPQLKLYTLIGILLSSSASYMFADCPNYGCLCLEDFVGYSPQSGNPFCIEFWAKNARQVYTTNPVGGILTYAPGNSGPSCAGYDVYLLPTGGCQSVCNNNWQVGAEAGIHQGNWASQGAMNCWECDFPDQIQDTCTL